MSTEQRRALKGTIPTTDVIREAVTFPRNRLGEPLSITPERFDAWLAQVRRDAARDALDGLAAYATECINGAHGHLSRDDMDGWHSVWAATLSRRANHYPEHPVDIDYVDPFAEETS